MRVYTTKMINTQCNCTKLRRVTKLVTKYYDEALEASGLKVTQFSLLRTLLRLGENVSISALAAASGLDRSTLGRNLRVIEKSGWIRFEGGDDLRARFVSVTVEGKEHLDRAIPLWERAQAGFSKILGDSKCDKLFELIAKLENGL